jgi:hypothetical protein
MCTSTTIRGGRPVAWFGFGCINDPAVELDREGLILLQVINEDFVECVERNEIAASIPEEVAASGQEIDSRLECGEQFSTLRNPWHRRPCNKSGSQRYNSC